MIKNNLYVNYKIFYVKLLTKKKLYFIINIAYGSVLASDDILTLCHGEMQFKNPLKWTRNGPHFLFIPYKANVYKDL